MEVAPLRAIYWIYETSIISMKLLVTIIDVFPSDNHYNPSKSSSPANEVASVSGCCQAAVSGGPEHPLNDVVP